MQRSSTASPDLLTKIEPDWVEDSYMFAGEGPDPRVARALVLERSHLHVLVSDTLEVVWVSPVVFEIGGFKPEDLIGRSAVDLIHPDDLEALAEVFAYELANPLAGKPAQQHDIQSIRYRVRLRGKDGTYTPFVASGTNLLAHPDVRALSVVLRVESYHLCLDDALEAILTDQPLNVMAEAIGRAVPIAFGPATQCLLVVNGVDLVAAADHDEVASIVRAIEAAAWTHPTEITSAIFAGGHRLQPITRADRVIAWLVVSLGEASTPHTASVCREIARIVQLGVERCEDKAALERAAALDPLTGALNRNAFRDRSEIELAGLTGRPFALLACDLDRFKDCNDEFGHPVGDAVLIEVVERIRSCVRKTDVVGRLGGDEFAVLLDGSSEWEVLAVAKRIVKSVSMPIETSRGAVTIGVSIGVAIGVGNQLDRVLEEADDALLRAKASGLGVVLAA